jgi:hypothetical protein
LIEAGRSGDDTGSGTIELAIPAQPVLLQLARMTAGVVAARADLNLDEVEDLRLAVDELCLALMGPTGHDGRLLLRYQWQGDTIEISGTVVPDLETVGDGAGGDGAEVDVRLGRPHDAERLRGELSAQILDALVDEHGETMREGRAGAWLRMRRQRAAEG